MAVVRYQEMIEEAQSFLDEFDFDPSVRLFIARGEGKLVKTDRYFDLKVENTNTSPVEIKGLFANHYNNPSGVKLYLNGSLTDHSRIVKEFSDAPALISGMKVSGNPSVIQSMNIALSFQNIWGAEITNLISLSAYFDSQQYQASVIEVPIALILSGYDGFDFVIPASESVSFTMYAKAVQKNDALLNVYIKREARKRAIIKKPDIKKAMV